MPWDLVKYILTGIVPPHDVDGNALYRWRVFMVVIVMANTASIAIHIALAYGLAPMFFPGFARSDDFKVQKAQFQSVIIGQLDSKILDTRTRQCNAIAAKNQLALQFATERLQDQLATFQKMTGGTPYRLPDCSEL